MYKALSVAVLLLAVFAFTSGSKSVGAVPPSPASPAIVARGAFQDQTQGLLATVYLPKANGLYRLSTYGTITTADPNSTSAWVVTAGWTDDAGVQDTGGILYGYGNTRGQFLFQGSSYLGGSSTFFEATPGSLISFYVSQQGPLDHSAYALYYVLERVE